ncbi:MAG: class I SAM-dependent methyltransferase [Acidobacteria bacterium]|nr:class I SAM-dependent methyltransferase [Acidobacteriota bacterium]
MTVPSFREWDSSAYDRISAPQFTWGKKVLDHLSLRGDEVLLDGGCGTGKLTGELLTLLPRGRLVAVDLSENMLRKARENVEFRFPARITFVVADLAHLPFVQAFDGIFSTAAFHWIPDHDRLFRSLYRTLRPGGWLVAQCGGGPNLCRLLARVDALSQTATYAAYVGSYQHRWTFSHPATTAYSLEAAGFRNVQSSLEPAPTRFEGEREFSEFVCKVILREFLEYLPHKSLRRQFLSELARQAGDDDPPYQLDYWRLNLEGRRPA